MRVLTACLIILAATVSAQTPQTYRFTHYKQPHELQEITSLVRAITEASSSLDTAAATVVYPENAAASWLLQELDKPSHDSPSAEYRIAAGDVVRVFYLAHSPNVQSLQEVATAVRATIGIRRLFTFNSPKAIAIRCTESEVATAQWLLSQLDREPSPDLQPAEYRMQGLAADFIKVFFVHTDSIQDLQELATLTRSITELRYLFTYNGLRAIMIRGSGDQVQMAESLLARLDRPAAGIAPRFERSGDPNDVVRVFRLAHSQNRQDLQELATLIRATAEIRRLFTFGTPRAIAIRGSSNQIALAEWLVTELDTTAVSGKPVYHLPEASDDHVGVLPIANAATPKELQEVAVQVRTTTAARRLFTYNRQKVVVLRGTSAQLAQAEKLILDRN